MREIIYNEIYSKLNSLEDIERISLEYGVEKSTLFSILSQKIVRKVKINYERYEKMIDKSSSIIETSGKLGIPPVIVARIILKKLGFGKKRIRKIIKNPFLLDNEEIKEKLALANPRIKEEIIAATATDFIFSPIAQEKHRKRGQYVEEKVKAWLERKKISFIREPEIDSEKTPDFLLNSSLTVNGREIFWIECKALFGDVNEHRYYLERQYRHYLRLFGSGMVVYWYSFLEDIKDIEPNLVIKDGSFFR